MPPRDRSGKLLPMTVTNHILVGAIIGLTVKNPVAATTLAFASHFVLDALPHFGYKGNRGYGKALEYKLTYWVATLSVISSIIVVSLLAMQAQWFALFTGLVAASPDVAGIYYYVAYERWHRKPTRLLELAHTKFHRYIQWCERPWGAIIEGAATIFLFWILYTIQFA